MTRHWCRYREGGGGRDVEDGNGGRVVSLERIANKRCGWGTVESWVRRRDRETEKCNVHRTRPSVSIHHYILPIRSSGVWCTILCPVLPSLGRPLIICNFNHHKQYLKTITIHINHSTNKQSQRRVIMGTSLVTFKFLMSSTCIHPCF